ncbi:MAG TPA: hypothetical protein VKQ09_05765 [Sphingomonas sp.]|nr:hypothetical protein [Sphingomonas sp.]
MDENSLWIERGPLPVLTDAQRKAAEQALAVFDTMPRGSSPEHVAALMGTAALAYPAGKLSAAEADARLAVYQSELADIDSSILGKAFSAAVRDGKFFPSIAELREHARRVPTPRRLIVEARLRRLLANRPKAAIDLVAPGQLSALFQNATQPLKSQESQHAA